MNRVNKLVNYPITPAPAAQFEQEAILNAFKIIASRYTALESSFFISGAAVTETTVGSTVTVEIAEGYGSFNGEPMYIPAQSLDRDVSEVMWLAPFEEVVNSGPYADRDGNPIDVEIRRTMKLTKGSNFPAGVDMLRLDASTQAQLDRILLGSAAKQVGEIWIQNITVDVNTIFDSTGLGIAGTLYEGVAICNGLNGTPDLRGRAPVGATDVPSSGTPLSEGVTENYEIGENFGVEKHQLTEDELPELTFEAKFLQTTAGPGSSLAYARPISESAPEAEIIAPKGNDEPHENRQPSKAVLYLMKVA